MSKTAEVCRQICIESGNYYFYTYMKRRIIGIFKVNDSRDGGYYIDLYLEKVLKLCGMDAECFVLNRSTVPLSNYNNSFCNYKNPVSAIIHLAAIINRRKIGIAYTCQFITLLYLLLLKPFYGFKLIVKVDGLTTRKGLKKYTFFLYDLIYPYLISMADEVIYETKLPRDKFDRRVRMGRSRVIYTPATNFSGLSLPAIELGATIKKEPVILFVGRYSEEKGYHLIGNIASQHLDCRFILIGGEKKVYQAHSNIEEIGLVTPEELLKWYARSDVLLVPSVSDAFPSVIREYAYFGKPVIATEVGSISEFRELGMIIRLVKPEWKSLSREISLCTSEYFCCPQNTDVFKRHFDPDKSDIQKSYTSLFCG